MKFAIKWHEESARNWRERLNRESANLTRQAESLAKSWGELQFKEQQIAEAKRRGLDAFDGDRFMVPRKPKP